MLKRRLMNIDFKDLIEELKILRLKTLDALLPPIIFALANGFFPIKYAGGFAILIGLIFLLLRIIKKIK